MKHIKIVFTLAVVVVIASVMVFYVEAWTTPKIDAYNFEQANLAKFEVLPTLTSSDNLDPDLTKDFTGTSITEVIVVAGKGYIYTAEFQGFQSVVTYMIGIDLNGNITGYKTLIQGDTPGLGAEIAKDWYKDQFPGVSINNITVIDGWTGATITFGGHKASLDKLIAFHNVAYGGAIVETDAEKLIRYKNEITVANAVLTDVTEDYTLSGGVTKIETANNGSEDVAVIYTVEFDGYVAQNGEPEQNVQYIIAFDINTNNVIGLRVIFNGETAVYGGALSDPSFQTQFETMLQADALNGNIDEVAGSSAPVTYGAFKDSLNSTVRLHQALFEGIVSETKEETIERLLFEIFPTGNSYIDVTRLKAPSHDIAGIYDVYNSEDVYLGVAYYADIIGASYGGSETYIEFLLGIDELNKFVGFRMIDDNETSGRTDAMYLEAYENSYIGDDADGTILIDSVASSTLTSDKLIDAANYIADYHMISYLVRPDSVTTSDANLLKAFPGATTFTSVYEDYDYNSKILNVYEAKDGTDTVLGYVYFSEADGFGSTNILFTWGINVAGTTESIAILNDVESWDDAKDYTDYNGSAGTNFNTTSWLENFEAKVLGDITYDFELDGVAGVSTTTDAMLTVLETIAQYHSDQSVGGGS